MSDKQGRRSDCNKFNSGADKQGGRNQTLFVFLAVLLAISDGALAADKPDETALAAVNTYSKMKCAELNEESGKVDAKVLEEQSSGGTRSAVAGIAGSLLGAFVPGAGAGVGDKVASTAGAASEANTKNALAELQRRKDLLDKLFAKKKCK